MQYRVYQGSSLLTTTSNKTYAVANLSPLQTYQFSVCCWNGLREGTKQTISVQTKGYQFKIAKTLPVGSTVNLKYQEYSLGLVPIGTEPPGMFGGGNQQSLTAKVISSSNGNSVVELTTAFAKMPASTLTLQNGVYCAFNGYKAIYLK